MRGGARGVLVPLLFASSAVITAVLIVGGLRLRRASLARGTRSLRQDVAAANADRTRRRFRLVGILEGLGIGIVVFVCVGLGRPELIPAAVALVVGLHFFPLAPLFRVPLYHATGAALYAWSPWRRRSWQHPWVRRRWRGK